MKKGRYALLIGILILDQVVKYLVRSSMFVGQSIPVIQNVFHFTYIRNTGAAFNLFDGMATFLTLFPIMALLVAVWYMERHLTSHWTFLLSMVLIISGGLGNLIDRLSLGYVTDMFDFRFFPVFNIADIAICVGCGLLVLYMFVFEEREHVKEETKN